MFHELFTYVFQTRASDICNEFFFSFYDIEYLVLEWFGLSFSFPHYQ
jgi:hypothetical protein